MTTHEYILIISVGLCKKKSTKLMQDSHLERWKSQNLFKTYVTIFGNFSCTILRQALLYLLHLFLKAWITGPLQFSNLKLNPVEVFGTH